jgi:hypothetical protein
MSDTKNTGGPAFPIGSGDMRDPMGMTLRDYFAAKAMHYYLSTVQEDDISVDGAWTHIAVSDAAQHAYMMADAMIKAREQ